MSHLIQQFDTVLSVQGTEWHGLAKHVPAITADAVSPLLFPLRESVSSNFILDDGSETDGERDKAIFADCRGRNDIPRNFVQLATMGEGYQRIENGALWEAMATAFDGAGVAFTVSCVGTLGNLRKFFISVSLDDHKGFTCGNDEFLSNLNFITSHDGTLECMAYDSTVRIVCMNTLRWSLEAAGAVDFRVRHTKGSALAMENLSELLGELLKGRDVFQETMANLASVPLSIDEAENLFKGYLARTNKVKAGHELSARSKNAATELVNLFLAGQGNHGETAYDALNAATEFWTSGSGTGGKDTTPAKRVNKSAFGMAAEHKTQFAAAIANNDTRAELLSLGKEFASIYA